MALKFNDRWEYETLFLQLGEEEGKDLGKICFAPLVAKGDQTTVEDCAVQSVWGYLKNVPDLPEDYIDKMMKCIRWVITRRYSNRQQWNASNNVDRQNSPLLKFI